MGHQNIEGSPKIKNKYLFAVVDTEKRRHVTCPGNSNIFNCPQPYVVPCKECGKLVDIELWTKGGDLPFRTAVKG